MNDHPQITELLKRRQARRRRLARLSFEEKIEVVERLRETHLNRAMMKKQQLKGKEEGERSKA